MTTDTSDGARPVAVVITNVIGVDMVWVDPPPASRPLVGTLLYTAADYDALRAEVERLREQLRSTRAERDTQEGTANQAFAAHARERARAEAAEATIAKTRKHMDFVVFSSNPQEIHERTIAAYASLNEGGE